MMWEIFDVIFRMSVEGIVIFAIVFALRLLLKKLHISHKYIVILWMLLFFYLVFPWKLELPVGFWNYDTVEARESEGNAYNENETTGGEVEQDMPVFNGASGSTMLQESVSEVTHVSADTEVVQEQLAYQPQGMFWIRVKTAIPYAWLVVNITLFGHFIYSYMIIRRKLAVCVHDHDNVYLAQDIRTPMVFGLFRPKVYLPLHLDKANLLYVLAHEKMHIRRRDYIIKILAYVICMLHWFNPFAWIAYHLLGSDIEKACDEAVVRCIGEDKKKEYANALLSAASGKLNRKEKIFVAPICFDEGDVKARIENIVKYKYTLPIAGVVIIVTTLVLAAVFMTKTQAEPENIGENLAGESNASKEGTVDGDSYNLETEIIYHPESSLGENWMLKSLSFYTDDEEITVNAIGKKLEPYDLYGVKEIDVYQGDNLIQAIAMQEAIEKDGIPMIEEGYTRCYDVEEVIDLKDINFDGYIDLEVFAWDTKDDTHYYYYCWNPDDNCFEYAFCEDITGIDEENQLLISKYLHSRYTMYYIDYYTITEDYTLELVDRDKEAVLDEAVLDARREVFVAVLEDLFYHYQLPGRESPGFDGFGTSKFAIYDIDDDGREELMIFYTTTVMAGQIAIIYDYDEETGEVYEEFAEFPTLTFYNNEVIVANASHNHGMAPMGDFWPYTLYQYDEAKDKYIQIAYVDAWEKEYAENDWEGNPYPENVDTDGDGIVYYIMTDGEYQLENPVDNAEYEQWLNSYIGGVRVEEISYVDLTEENINDLK